jgi:hypothetical protein
MEGFEGEGAPKFATMEESLLGKKKYRERDTKGGLNRAKAILPVGLAGQSMGR